MKKNITKNITWVGKVDWELRKFHGDEYSTHRGTTYNSYLIRGEKNILIDTVWKPYAKEFVENLKKEIDPEDIDIIVANHGEIDHSGALPELMKEIPETPIYCTANAVKSLKGHYHKDWNFKTVKTGDKISLGEKELTFIEAPMLHWPDTMFCYLSGDNVLFSNDGFGQHYATENLYNDLVDQAELYQEAIKYYANILTPYSMMVDKKINEILDMGVDVDIICPSHGVIWRDNPKQIIEKYLEWADNYRENQVTILYDTMWGGTRKMAEAITEGIKKENNSVEIKMFNLSKTDKNDVVTEVFKSKGVLVGSPTINRGILTAVAGELEEIRGLGFKGKKAAAFGTYGWSGEGAKMISGKLDEGGFEIVKSPLKEMWNPNSKSIDNCVKFGRSFIINIS